MAVVDATELRDVVRAILQREGASEVNAQIVADHLVDAQRSGVDTHGVYHLVFGGNYVDAMRRGAIVPSASPETVWEHGNSALVSGNWTFGHVTADYATSLLSRLAQEAGIAVVGVVQANHIGRLGHYSERLAAEGLVGMVFAGGFAEEIPSAVPFGGRAPLLSTNPISMAFPAGQEPRVMFDFATTTLAGSRVTLTGRRGNALPPGALVDKEGRPTTDPQDYLDGGWLTLFGGHKGYALAMAVEFLTRILVGSDDFADEDRSTPYERHQGVLMVALRANLFSNRAKYESRADELIRRTHAVPPAAGHDRVLVPGDPELESRKRQDGAGIAVDDDLWDQISSLGQKAMENLATS